MVAASEIISKPKSHRRFLHDGMRHFRASNDARRPAHPHSSDSQLLTSNPSLHANLFRYPSLAFNAGPKAVSPKHEMMQAVNTGHVTGKNFTAYDKITVNGKKVVSRGLLQRREAEYKIFSERKP